MDTPIRNGILPRCEHHPAIVASWVTRYNSLKKSSSVCLIYVGSCVFVSRHSCLQPHLHTSSLGVSPGLFTALTGDYYLQLCALRLP